MGDILEKKSVQYFRSFDVHKALFKTPCLNHTFMFPYKLDAVFEQKCCRKKLRVPPLVNPRAVEIDMFADLTISKEGKRKLIN